MRSILLTWLLAPLMFALAGSSFTEASSTVPPQQSWPDSRGTQEREAEISVLVEQGVAALARKDYAGAISHFSRIIELLGHGDPQTAPFYRHRAQAYAAAGKMQAALSDYGTAIKFNPDDFSAYVDRSYLLLERNELVPALNDIAQALRIFPTSNQYIQQGKALEQLKRIDEAVASYTNAIRIAPEYYEARVRASTDEEEKKMRLRHRDHDMALARIRRGDIYRDRREFDKALADYSLALQWEPYAYEVYLSRGYLFEKRGEKSLARADYERAAAFGEPIEWLKRAIARVK